MLSQTKTKKMHITKLMLLAAGISILGAGCTKEKKSVQQYDYTYTNSTNKDIRVDIYKSIADYNNNTNLYLTGIAAANGGTVVVPSSDFQAGVKYYVDWYTNDYTYTNWQNRQGFYDEFETSFLPTYQNNKNTLESVNDYARLVFLGGGAATETNWIAIDGVAYPGGNTTQWADLPDSYKYRKFKFKKDFSCTYYSKTESGLDKNDKFTFRTPYLGTSKSLTEGMIYINIEDQHEVSTWGTVTYGINQNATDPNGNPTFSNTITVDFGDQGRYIMVRDSSVVN
jgi:hypothetical protein